jgi:hypothetical protein
METTLNATQNSTQNATRQSSTSQVTSFAKKQKKIRRMISLALGIHALASVAAIVCSHSSTARSFEQSYLGRQHAGARVPVMLKRLSSNTSLRNHVAGQKSVTLAAGDFDLMF